MGQFSNSFPKHFSYLCEYAIRFVLSCSFCEYPLFFHCLHCSPSCFDPDSLLLAHLWLGLSWIYCISANKSFSSRETSSRKPYTSSKQQERQKHSVETTINFSRSRLREYVDSKRKLVAKKLCYAKPTRSSWPLKQGRMGYLSRLKEDLEQKITTWQRDLDLKLMKSVWGAHVRTPEEDDLSEECVCEPPRACLCCHRPPEMVGQDLYAYQRVKDTTKGEESVEDHLPTSITQGASNLHSDEDMEDKIKLLDPRVQKLMRTYLEVFGELPPPASGDKLVQMDLKLKPEFVGHKIRRRPYPAPKEQGDEIERQIQECIDARLVLEYKDGDYPLHCSPCFLVAKPASTAKRLVVDYRELNKKTLNHSGSIPNMESTLEKIASCRYKTKMDKRS